MTPLKNKTVLVTGGAGFLGSWVVNALQKEHVAKIVVPRSRQLDLRDYRNCQRALQGVDIVIHLAAYVGGIGLNKKHPGKLFYDNALMGLHLIEAARHAEVEKLLITGTACSYPKNTPVPFDEKHFWDGFPEAVTGVYGMAKKILLVAAQAYREEYGLNSIYLIPTNLYGPGDNDDPESGHVIPSLIRRMHEAKMRRGTQFPVWGSGRATRDFLYVADAADAIVQALKRYNEPHPVNIGSGKETSIRHLVGLLKKYIGFRGRIVWDTTKPDGQKRRKMSIARARKAFGFTPTTSLEQGLQSTVEVYLQKL